MVSQITNLSVWGCNENQFNNKNSYFKYDYETSTCHIYFIIFLGSGLWIIILLTKQ